MSALLLPFLSSWQSSCGRLFLGTSPPGNLPTTGVGRAFGIAQARELVQVAMSGLGVHDPEELREYLSPSGLLQVGFRAP